MKELVYDRSEKLLSKRLDGNPADKATLTADLETVRRERAVNVRLLREHTALDVEMRRTVKAWVDLAKVLELRERAEGVNLTKSHPYRSRAAVYMRAVDDKTAYEWPYVFQQSFSTLERFKTECAGQ